LGEFEPAIENVHEPNYANQKWKSLAYMHALPPPMNVILSKPHHQKEKYQTKHNTYKFE